MALAPPWPSTRATQGPIRNWEGLGALSSRTRWGDPENSGTLLLLQPCRWTHLGTSPRLLRKGTVLPQGWGGQGNRRAGALGWLLLPWPWPTPDDPASLPRPAVWERGRFTPDAARLPHPQHWSFRPEDRISACPVPLPCVSIGFCLAHGTSEQGNEPMI